MEIVTAEAAQAPVAAKLAFFAQHKTALLSNLRDMHERAPGVSPSMELNRGEGSVVSPKGTFGGW